MGSRRNRRNRKQGKESEGRYLETCVTVAPGFSSAGVKISSAGVRLAYAEYNLLSPPMRL